LAFRNEARSRVQAYGEKRLFHSAAQLEGDMQAEPAANANIFSQFPLAIRKNRQVFSYIKTLRQDKIKSFPRGYEASSGELQKIYLEDVFMSDKNQKKAPGTNKKAKKTGEDKDPIDSLLDAGSAYTK
jgi:hypothetical protein